MPRENARRTVELLGQHDPDQKMRPSPDPKGDAVLGALPQGPEALRPTDQKGRYGHTAISQPGKMGRESLAGQAFSRWIERDAVGAAGNRGAERLALLSRGLAPALHLMETPGRQTEPRRQRLEAAGILLIEKPLRRGFLQPPGGNNIDLQRLGSGGGDGLGVPRHIGGPELLELVKLAHLRPEDVDDGIARVNQHPIAMRQPLDTNIPFAGRFQPFDEMLGDGADVPLRAAARNDHLIGKRRLTGEVDRYDVFGFVVFERVENELDEIRAIGWATTVTGQVRFSRVWERPDGAPSIRFSAVIQR
jgi:hypothetical protein